MKDAKLKQEQKFRHQFTPGYQGSPGESSNLESMTIPDETLTVRQLLINHSRGIGIPQPKQGIFTGDTVAPKPSDLVDEKSRVEALKTQIEETDEQARREHQEAVRKRKEDAQLDKNGKPQEPGQGAEPKE